MNCVYPTCNAETEFQCRNFKCIPAQARCNGVIDCQDGNGTDEVGCPPISCNGTVYDVKCPNTNICIMRRWLCDGNYLTAYAFIIIYLINSLYFLFLKGDNDCGDNADENQLFCRSVPCNAGQFR